MVAPPRQVFVLIERGWDHENPLAAYLSMDDAVAAASEEQWPLARIDGLRTDVDSDDFHRVLVIERLPLR
jgi:hypothetical protein